METKKKKKSWESINLFQGSRGPTGKNGKREQKKDQNRDSHQSIGNNANIGWLFAKDYYNELERIKNQSDQEQSTYFEHKNKGLVYKKLSDYNDELTYLHLTGNNISGFELETTYPGLFTGSGIPHETGTMGEFKLGFFFDHTTGLPIIPGSSIKGVLRLAFNHPDYIEHLLKEVTLDIDIEALEHEIFAGEKKDKDNKNGKIIYNPLIECKRDIFFDAVILKTKNKNGLFLGEDFITPHKDEFKDPVPLRFLKILPGVTFRFQFILNDGVFVKIEAKEKLALFKKILLDLGIGAKTNVGYGKLEELEM